MKNKVEKIGACRVGIKVEVTADEVRPVREKIVRDFMAHGRLPGFRPGKAPRAMVESAYRGEIERSFAERVVNEFCRKAVDEAKVENLIAAVDVDAFAVTSELGGSFRILADVEPEVSLPKYKKFVIALNEPQVSDQDVTDRIEEHRKSLSKFSDDVAADTAAAINDLVQMDFDATIDGKPLKEVAPDAAQLSSAKDFWMQMDPTRFLKEVVEGVVGMKIGEKKEIAVVFPKEIPFEALREKSAVFAVSLKKIRKCQPATDAELLESAKAESMEKMRADLKAQMQKVAEAQEKSRRENEVVTQLLKDAEFDLPESAVARETDREIDQLLRMAQYRGMGKDQIESARTEILEQATKRAKNTLRIRYLLKALAAAEKLEATDDDCAQRIAELAEQGGTTAEELRKTIEANGNMEVLRQDVLSAKAIQFVIDNAKRK